MQWCPHHFTNCLALRQMGLNPLWLADSVAIWILPSLDILIQKARCSWFLQHCPLQARCQCYLPLQQLHRNTSVTIQWHYILHSFSLVNQIVMIGRGDHYNKPFLTFLQSDISQKVPLKNSFKKGYKVSARFIKTKQLNLRNYIQSLSTFSKVSKKNVTY